MLNNNFVIWKGVTVMTNNTSKLNAPFRKILAGMLVWVLAGVIPIFAPFFLQEADYSTIDRMYTLYTFIAITAAFGLFYAIYYLTRMMQFAESNRDWKRVGLTVAGVIVVASFISVLLAGQKIDASDAELQQLPQQDVVYLTYSTTCDFCIISESSAKEATNEYKFATGVQVKHVDIDKDNPLANELRKHIKGKGSIVKLHGNNVTAVVFTHGDGKGNPVKTPTETVYRYVQEVSTSGK